MQGKIVVTGAAGFIGSVLAAALNDRGYSNLILSDDFSRDDKALNYINLQFTALVDRAELPQWLIDHASEVGTVFHLGARTDTAEWDEAIFERLNVAYTKYLWQICSNHQIPFLYASSAATYGLGEHGYSDSHEVVPQLQPLNPYGWSKQWVDEWVLQQTVSPPAWFGIKFFNVYGPNEYHKGRMASVVFHAFRQIRETGRVALFRSHHPDYKDGEQLRDFIYVLDAVDVLCWLMEHKPASGLYNLGTGQAETFLELAESTFEALGLPPQIDFIDTPADIRDKYQYYTCADMEKLRRAGYSGQLRPLRSGVADYVQRFLVPGNYR